MMQSLVSLVKSAAAFFGFFVARQWPGMVNWYTLAYDLKVVLPKEQPVCFDVGANQGQTITLLQSTYANPIIHAFEPAAATFAALAKQAFGSQVHLHQLALGERVQQAEFRNYAQSELSSLLPLNPNQAENLFASEKLMSTEFVQVETLDEFCSKRDIGWIDLLKIDTQGFELPVLRGGDKLFKEQRIGAVLLELNFANLYQGQSDALVILSLLRAHQMHLVDFYENERVNGNALSWTTALFIQRKQPTVS